MDNFFLHCQRFDGSPAAEAEMTRLLKVTIGRIINLPSMS